MNGLSEKHLQKLGIFRLSIDLINISPKLVQKIFSDVIPIKVTHDFINMTIEYIGISDKFDDISVGEIIPEYMFQCDSDNNITASRV